jgi:hypothetical protein
MLWKHSRLPSRRLLRLRKLILSYGLPVFGFTIERQASVRRLENLACFKEHFGVKPLTVAALLNDLKKEFTKDFRVKEALMTLYWLKCYGTERTIAARLHTLLEPTQMHVRVQ